MQGSPRSQRSKDAELEHQLYLTQAWGDAAGFVFWAGVTFLGIFATTVILNSMPFALIQSEWQQRFTTILLDAGPTGLLGTVLVCLSRLFDLQNIQLGERVRFVRRLASWVAIGWLLMIPAQLFLGTRLLRQGAKNEDQQLSQVVAITKAIKASTNEAEFRAAVARMPQPPPLPDKFAKPLDEIRNQSVRELEVLTKTIDTRLRQNRSRRWQAWLREVVRNSLLSLLLATGFASIGRSPTSTTSLLRQLISGFQFRTSPHRQMDPQGIGSIQRWIDDDDKGPSR